MVISKATKKKFISVNKWDIIQFIISSSLIFNRIQNAISENLGDAYTYQKFYLSFLKTGVWPYGVAGGGEPSFVLISKFSSLMGKYGLAITLAVSLAFLIIKITHTLNLNKLTPLIFSLSFLISFNTVTLHLCTSWRTAFSSILALFFLQSFFNKENKNNFISLIFFLLTIFSHSTGAVIIASFLSTQLLIFPIFKRIKKFKIRYDYIFYFIFSYFLIFLIAYPILINSSYIWTRIGEYFNYDALNEVKSYSQFFIKALLLIIAEIYLSTTSSHCYLSKRLHQSLSFHYISLLAASLVLPVLITDRLINSIYWLTFLCLISLTSNILIKNFKSIYRL